SRGSGARLKKSAVHHGGTFHDRGEIHAVQNIGLEFHPGGDLGQFDPLGGEPEDGALGDVEDVLTALLRVGAAEGYALDMGAKLPQAAMRVDRKLAVSDLD